MRIMSKQAQVIATLFAASFLAFILIGFLPALGSNAHKAFAADETLQTGTAKTAQLTTQASSKVRYVAVFGTDARFGTHPAASDIMMVLRVDASAGTVNILSIPRDIRYDALKKQFPKTKIVRASYAFRNMFIQTINKKWTNYNTAIRKSSASCCKMIRKLTGIPVTSYAAVDFTTFQQIVDLAGGMTVKLPLGIKYYNEAGKVVKSYNNGKPGTVKVSGADALQIVRTRKAYIANDPISGKVQYKYWDRDDYSGNLKNLLAMRPGMDFYSFDGDGVRQFVVRRSMASLINKGLSRKEGAASFAWDTLVSAGLIWTNLSKDDITYMANGLAKAKKANKFVVYGAAVQNPTTGKDMKVNGEKQYLIPLNKKQIKATAKQFMAGQAMTDGWGDETIIGLAKGRTKKVSGITYKATSNSKVAVTKIPNKKTVVIPDTVKINGKTYYVTSIAAKSMKGSKVRTVVLGKRINKLYSKSFSGSKVTTVKVKSTLLTKARVKNCFKDSKVKKVKIIVDKASLKKTYKAYKKAFTKKNTGASKAVKVYY